MSARIITAIAFKVFAIYLCVQVILQIPSIWSIYETLGPWISPNKIASYTPYLIACIFILLGFATVVVIYRLGNSVLEAVTDSTICSEAAKLEAVFFQLLGVYFAVTALTYLPGNIILSTYDNLYEPDGTSLLAKRFTVAANLIELVFAGALIAKAPAWQSLFYKLRQLGSGPYNKSSQDDA